MDYLSENFSNEELQGVKDVIASFLIGLKNYTIYPENNGICTKSLENAYMRLDAFVKNYGGLRLDVTKDRLLYKNEVVFQESQGEENLATILFRDGIQWVHIFEGFEFNELKGFFRILKDYKTWREDADGDLVTAFWEANLSNFKYKAADVYWESEPLIDYSLLTTGNTENKADLESEEEQQSSLAVEIGDSESALWTLSAQEVDKLRKMVSEEEKRDNLNDLLFILFNFLKDPRKNNDLKFALEFLEAELREALAQGNFQFAFRLISGLWRMRRGVEKQKMWAMADLDQFFLNVSRPEMLSVVPEEFQSLDVLDSANMKLFCQFFLLLDPSAVHVLGPLVSKTKSLNIQQHVLQTIGAMAARNIRPLERLLESPDEFMVEKLVSVLGQLNGDRPIQILLKMLRHSSGGVRKEAVKQLVVRDPVVIKKLFNLVEDPNESVRKLVLKKLEKVRNEITESFFLDYLEKRQFNITGHQHVLACYRTLGRCGSYRSIAFLRGSLLNRCWLPDFRSIHRRGAIVALIALGTKESGEILQKAAKSLFPTVRIAYRKALEVI